MHPRTLVLVLASSAAGCGIADFHVSQPIREQHVTGSPVPAPLQFLFPVPLDVDISAKIKAQDSGPIDAVLLSSLHLDITATDEPPPDHDDWSFLTRVDLYIESTKDGTTLPKVKVATASMPGAVRQLTFTPEPDQNLIKYVNEGSRLSADASGTAPSDDLSFDGEASFLVQPL